MRKDIHPVSRPILFRDVSCGWEVVINSTASTRETAVFEGVEYPLFKVEVSSASHPFYNPEKRRVVDAGGRISKFRKRFGDMADLSVEK
jgi:large subunit ribosomal protein L31